MIENKISQDRLRYNKHINFKKGEMRFLEQNMSNEELDVSKDVFRRQDFH